MEQVFTQYCIYFWEFKSYFVVHFRSCHCFVSL